MRNIKTCPTCGSSRIKRVRRTITRTSRGRTYTVPTLEFYECPNCGEQVFSPEAIRAIQARSPAFKHAKTA